MPTQCSADAMAFAPVAGRAVVAGFDGGAITSDARALLLGATDRAVPLVERFAACFRDGREAARTEHGLATLVGQRVFGLALGYEDLVDHDTLRHDPVLAMLAGKLAARRSDYAPLARRTPVSSTRRSIARAATWRTASRNARPTSSPTAPRPRRCGPTSCACGSPRWLEPAPAKAGVLLCALRRIGLRHTAFAEATCGTIRLRLLKIGALVTISVRRVKVAMASGYPWQDEWTLAQNRLRRAAA